jgi:N-carbamoylputrescine amidase
MKIGLIQMGCVFEKSKNMEKASRMVEEAASKGAKIVCLQELFNTIYFAYEEDPKYFELAETVPGPTTQQMCELAKKLGVSIIAPIFEKDTDVPGIYYNTAVVIDSDGAILGKYRKTSLPQLPHYEEKFYFKPGNLGYPVFKLKESGVKIGVIICYDRHFLEGPRIEALKGAQIVFVPTCTSFYPELWELELRAHASFNTIYVAGVNRCGAEFPSQEKPYYGKSMVADPSGQIIAQAGSEEQTFVVDVDLQKVEERRRIAPFLRDRRPELYAEITQHLI